VQLLILALALTTAPAADFGDLVIPPARIGLVPTLRPPPADLPHPIMMPDGVLLPSPLDAYVAAEMVVLRRLPDLSQEALDAAVAAEKADGAAKVRDLQGQLEQERAKNIGFLGKVEIGLIGGAVGIAVGVVATVLLIHYVR